MKIMQNPFVEKKSRKILMFLLMTGLVTFTFPYSCTKENQGAFLNGTWHVEENSQLYDTQHYDANITQTDSTQLEISNFYNIGAKTYVTGILEGNAININKQDIEGYIIEGSGTVKNDYRSIVFHFTVNDGSAVDNVIAQFKR